MYVPNLVCVILAIFDSVTLYQRYSQNTTNARAQHGHTSFAKTSMLNAEATREVWGHAPPERFGAS